MKKYTTPEVEIMEINADDVIQTSYIFGGDVEVGGDSSIFPLNFSE